MNTKHSSPSVAIIYLSYHADEYLADMIEGLQKQTHPHDKIGVIVVDNPHHEYGSSATVIQKHVIDPLQGIFKDVVLLAQEENTGFAKGNNIGADWAVAHGYDYVFFHNDDGYLGETCLADLIEVLDSDDSIAEVQALMRLHPETDLVNNAGNNLHYLGFGYSNHYRVPVKDMPQKGITTQLGYLSGAARMISTKLYTQYGGWDESYFMYHEDSEWTLRLRVLGYQSALVYSAHFYHKYRFAKSIKSLYYMERNRIGLWFTYLKWKTLLVLLPMALVMEVGQWLFAYKGGWLDKKIDIYKYWAKKSNRKDWWKKRQHAQHVRRISDRELLSYTVPTIGFQETDNVLLTYIGNPLMRVYYAVVVKGIIWW